MDDLSPKVLFRERLAAGEILCFLPVARAFFEEPLLIAPAMAAFPPCHFKAIDFHDLSSPQGLWDGLAQAGDEAATTAREQILSGSSALAWVQGGATGISGDDFFASALVAFPIALDWSALKAPERHADHLSMMRSAIRVADDVFDLVRFDYCLPWEPGTLPGRPGLLDSCEFTSALFYSTVENKGYILAGEVHRHKVIAGLGLDMSNVAVVLPSAGEVGQIARHGLRLYSAALEANSETAKFMQMMTLVEFLADPYEFSKMTDARKQIARHFAKSNADYQEIGEYFKFLTSEGGKIKPGQKGLRHNIVHMGKTLEELLTPGERLEVFKNLWRFVGVPLQHMLQMAGDDWSEIEKLRERRGRELGL